MLSNENHGSTFSLMFHLYIDFHIQINIIVHTKFSRSICHPDIIAFCECTLHAYKNLSTISIDFAVKSTVHFLLICIHQYNLLELAIDSLR